MNICLLLLILQLLLKLTLENNFCNFKIKSTKSISPWKMTLLAAKFLRLSNISDLRAEDCWDYNMRSTWWNQKLKVLWKKNNVNVCRKRPTFLWLFLTERTQFVSLSAQSPEAKERTSKTWALSRETEAKSSLTSASKPTMAWAAKTAVITRLL